MTDSTFNKIKTLIENSKSFGVLMDENPEEHEFLAKEVLTKTILKKDTPVLNLPKETEDFKQKWSDILEPKNNIELPQKTSIKIPKGKYQIKEVSYKEDDESLSFIITSPQNELALEDLSLEKLPPEAEAVFCFFEEEEKLSKFSSTIQLPQRENTIFIGPDGKTLTSKILDIIKIFNPEIYADNATNTLLLAALLTETNHFAEKINKEVFSLASLLIEKGGDLKTILKIIEKEKSPFLAQLVGRALARTYTDESLGISWSFLNQRDLQRTNNNNISTSSLYKLLKNVGTFIPSQNLYVLIWQTIEGIKAMITTSEDKSREYLMNFAEKLQAQPQSRFFIIGPFENFSEAEKHLRQILQEEINGVLKNYSKTTPEIIEETQILR